jgi:hypothetical protein
MILRTPQPTCIRPRTSQDTVRQREVIWYRKDFGTDTGWREIRGVQVVGLDRRLASLTNGRPPDSDTRIQDRYNYWYLDRLGKVSSAETEEASSHCMN